MAQIFISYSKQDIEFARHLRTLLQNAGFDAWLDERLVPSTQWWRMLEGQIKKSTAFIVIMSPSSAESRWVEREILVAENANLPIFPVLLAGGGWSRLADIQYEDFTAGLRSTLPQRFIDGLRAVIDGKSTTSPPSQPIKVTSPQTESRLLESAMPAETVAGADTEMWAKISLPDSPGLRAELPAVVPSGDVIQRGDARTSSFPFRFPTDPKTGEKLPAHVTLKASSADFIIRSPGGDDTEYVELPPDSDSRTIIFGLLPKPGGRISGRARVFLDLIYENRVIAQISVSTQLVAQVTRIQDGAAPWGMWSVPVGSASAGVSGYGTPSAAQGGAVLEQEESLKRDDFAAADADLDDLPLDEAEAIPAPAVVDRVIQEKRPEAPPESPDEDWRGALPNTPFPPPPTTPPDVSEPTGAHPQAPMSTATEASDDKRSSYAGADRRAPAPKSRGSVISFPAVSAIAGLVFVFVIVLMVVNNSTQNANVQSTTQASTNTALNVATVTQRAVIELTGVANEPTLTSVAETPPDRNGIAVTRLIGCTTEAMSLRLINLIDEIGVEANALPGATDGEAIEAHRSEMEAGSHAIVIRGFCEDISQQTEVVLHADILDPPQIGGLIQPTEVEFRIPADDMNESDGIAADFLHAMALYLNEEFNAELLNRLARVYDAIQEESLNAAGMMEIDLLLGIAHLLFENGYAPALSRFARVNPEAADAASILTIAIAALNNAGAAEIAHAEAVDATSEEFATAVDNAESYLDQAAEWALDDEQREVIQANRERLESLVESQLAQ